MAKIHSLSHPALLAKGIKPSEVQELTSVIGYKDEATLSIEAIEGLCTWAMLTKGGIICVVCPPSTWLRMSANIARVLSVTRSCNMVKTSSATLWRVRTETTLRGLRVAMCLIVDKAIQLEPDFISAMAPCRVINITTK